MKLRNTSASQVEAFRRCKRYWFYGWVLKLKGPTTPAMQRGTDIHAEIEHWLKTGKIRVPISKLPARVVKGLDKIDAEVVAVDDPLVAKYHEHAIATAVMLTEKLGIEPRHADLLVEQRIEIPTGKGLPYWLGFIDIGWSGRTAMPLGILDTKSTSDFRYAKTKEELRKNPQVNSYCHWAYEIRGYPEDKIETGHGYIHTKTHKTKLPNTKFVTTEVTRESVANVWNACIDDVRGMVDIAASVTDAQEVEPTTTACGMYGGCPHLERCGIAKEAFTNFFNSNQNQKSTKEIVPMSSLLEKLRAAKGGNTASEGGEAPAELEAPKVPTGVLPDDAPDRTTPVEAKTESEETQETTAEKPKKRGRPKGSSNKKSTKKTSSGGFTLYQNCFPTKGANGIVRYEDWFQPIFELIDQTAAEQNNVGGYWALSFAQQKDFLAKSVAAYIEENGLPSSMVVMGSPMLASDVLPHLAARAAVVVNAVR